jgi:aspartyl-tRNA(Asn)/glutamyl-tRNA(Gln) amidotransferase subunit C
MGEQSDILTDARVKPGSPTDPPLGPRFIIPSMALTLEDVKRIAHLARLETSEEEARAALAQLSDIFGMIETIAQADTRGIEPMSHPLGGVQRLREDVVTEPDVRADAFKNAPQTEGGYFLVPKVIE